MPGIETAMIGPLTSSLADNLTAHTINQAVNRVWSSPSSNIPQSPEPLEWAKFAMWLRGFLGALEGRELTTEDIDKIMDKLSTVDPESQNWRYPYVPPPPAQPWRTPNIGNPPWTPYNDRTTWTYKLEDLRAYYRDQLTTSDGTGATTDTVQNDNDAIQSP